MHWRQTLLEFSKKYQAKFGGSWKQTQDLRVKSQFASEAKAKKWFPILIVFQIGKGKNKTQILIFNETLGERNGSNCTIFLHSKHFIIITSVHLYNETRILVRVKQEKMITDVVLCCVV